MNARGGGLSAAQREVRLYAELTRVAALGELCPTADELSELLCTNSVGATVFVMQRLERRGLIKVERFQKGRIVTICATGEKTARPKCTTPHWRDRPRDVPAPAPLILRERRPDMAADIARWASQRGVTMVEALTDLVFVGWEIERSRG